MLDSKVRKVNPDATWAEDLEPEYIVVTEDSKTAYVILQEANAVAVLNLDSKAFTGVNGLGYKDHSDAGKGLDASNKSEGIDIRPWPVLGTFQPDGVDLFQHEGKNYLITANEGYAADYDGFSEETRVKDMVDQYALNAELFAGFTQTELDQMVTDGLFDDEQLGRLKTTTSAPKNAEGKYEAVYAYGGRSFSIWDMSDMSLVYDSGDELERMTAKALPEHFNVSNSKNTFKNRSDDKGPEPETTVIGKVGNHTYTFAALERTGGIVAYNISNPVNPYFVEYFSTRDFSKDEPAGDLAPEGLYFVNANESPTGKALLLAAHEVSGTIAVYEIEVKPSFAALDGMKKITVVYTNNFHSRIEAGSRNMGYEKVAAWVKKYRAAESNVIILDSGDTFHRQTISTLVQGESLVPIMNAIGYDAMTAGNHDFNYGTDRLLELGSKLNFPILGGNVVKKDG